MEFEDTKGSERNRVVGRQTRSWPIKLKNHKHGLSVVRRQYNVFEVYFFRL